MSKKFDIITALDTCVDFILSGKDTHPEYCQKEKLVDDYFVEMGGSSCIFACQAAKLGLKTAGVGLRGDDLFGELVHSKLVSAGVDTRNLKIDKTLKTGVGIALTENNDRAILTYPGTIAAAGLEMQLTEMLSETQHLHIGSYFIMDGIRPYYFEIVRKAKKLGVTVSLDPNWDPHEEWDMGLLELLPLIDVFFLNENELRGITKTRDISAAVAQLCEKVKLVVIKQGENGASAYNKTGMVSRLEAYTVEVIDTIGAGDSFDAGFLYGFLNGHCIKTCLAIAVYCGSMSARGRGGITSQVDLTEVEGRF